MFIIKCLLQCFKMKYMRKIESRESNDIVESLRKVHRRISRVDQMGGHLSLNKN